MREAGGTVQRGLVCYIKVFQLFSLRLGEPQKDPQQMNVMIYICDIGDLKTWPAGCHRDVVTIFILPLCGALSKMSGCFGYSL